MNTPSRRFPAIDEAREIDVLEHHVLDGRVPADGFVRIASEQQELAVGECAPVPLRVRERQREATHQLQGRCRLHHALEPGVVRQRAEQAEEVEPAIPHQRERRRDAAGRKERIGVGEEQELGIRRGARARHAGMQRVDLADPVVRTGVDFDDLEPVIIGDLRAGQRRGVVGAAVERQHEPQLRIGLVAQRADEPGDDARLVVGGNHHAHPARRRIAPRRASAPRRSVGTLRIVCSRRIQITPQSSSVATGPTPSVQASVTQSQCGIVTDSAPAASVGAHPGASIHACAGSLWKCQTRCGPAITLR